MEEKTGCITINCGCCGNGGGNDSGGGFPGDEYIDIPLTYTAESNGYVYVHAVTDNSREGLLYIGSSNGMHTSSFTYMNNTNLHTYLPVRAGSEVTITLSHSSLVSARFYPAV